MEYLVHENWYKMRLKLSRRGVLIFFFSYLNNVKENNTEGMINAKLALNIVFNSIVSIYHLEIDLTMCIQSCLIVP